MKVTLMPFEAQSVAEYAPALAAMAAQRVDAVFTFNDVLGRETALADGLIAYGPSIPDMYRQAAVYVDKILRGARPAELPIEQPTKFDFVINLKAAKALGLTIPKSLLLRADEVVE
jgi:putative ABC transport system substrate-binding protein